MDEETGAVKVFRSDLHEGLLEVELLLEVGLRSSVIVPVGDHLVERDPVGLTAEHRPDHDLCLLLGDLVQLPAAVQGLGLFRYDVPLEQVGQRFLPLVLPVDDDLLLEALLVGQGFQCLFQHPQALGDAALRAQVVDLLDQVDSTVIVIGFVGVRGPLRQAETH